MEKTEETLEEKQEYLRDNILDKGYDAEEFLTFLQQTKGVAGLDLNNWSMNELIEITNNFTKQNQNGINVNNTIDEKSDNISVNENYMDNIDNLIERVKTKNITNDNEQNEFTNCKLIEKTPITENQNLEIKVSNPRKANEGIFSSSYSLYTIEIKSLNLKVDRKFSDFEWLHNILTKYYINCIVPPITVKQDKFFNKNLEKRARVFETFLNNIALHPILRNSKIFYDFVSIKKREEFTTQRKIYQKMAMPKTIHDARTLNGKIKVTVTDDVTDKIFLFNVYLKQKKGINDKLNKNFKLLKRNFLELISIMKTIANNWKEIKIISQSFMISDNNGSIFEAANKVMEEWAKFTKNQITMVDKFIREHLKFVNDEENKFINIFNIIEKKKLIYTKKNGKLIDEKEALYKKNNISEWKLGKNENENLNKKELFKNKNYAFSLMIPEDTEKVHELKNQFGFYLNIYNDEFERLRKLNISKYKKIFGNLFLEKMKENLINFHVSLNESVGFIDSLQEI